MVSRNDITSGRGYEEKESKGALHKASHTFVLILRFLCAHTTSAELGSVCGYTHQHYASFQPGLGSQGQAKEQATGVPPGNIVPQPPLEASHLVASQHSGPRSIQAGIDQTTSCENRNYKSHPVLSVLPVPEETRKKKKEKEKGKSRSPIMPKTSARACCYIWRSCFSVFLHMYVHRYTLRPRNRAHATNYCY